jgi:LytS/YehU family sensor histidine kinase
LFITADYYVIVYYLMPRFFKKGWHVWFTLYSAGIIAFSALLRALLSVQMNLHVFNVRAPLPFGSLYLTSLLNILIWVEVIVMGKMLADRIYNQQQMAALERERAKHELEFLKAQINPHALFNSLNTIYGHIDKQNQTARNILLKFSGLLRYQLYDCNEDKINLGKEIEYIRNYISFQQIRKEKNLEVEVNIASDSDAYQVAPLMLVILIENAFKFVSCFTGKENKISIRLKADKGRLDFGVRNTTEAIAELTSPFKTGGIGLINLRRRLELLYPGRHNLALKHEGNLYEATLELELL